MRAKPFKNDFVLFPSAGHSNYRIPSVIATNGGTVMAFCNDRRDTLADAAKEAWVCMARKKTGGSWESVRTLQGYPGWSCMIGSAIYDGQTDTSMVFATRSAMVREEFGSYTEDQMTAMREAQEKTSRESGIKPGTIMLVSSDEGETWKERAHQVQETVFTDASGEERETVASLTHGSGHGIQLRHGAYAGRLLCPSRFMLGNYTTLEGLCACAYNNAIYSDDHGKTWFASAPVQVGTGEGTLMENRDGSVTYNSRAYYQDQKRYLATSRDGGQTYGDFRTDPFLLEEAYFGCNASLIRVEREEMKNGDLLPDWAESLTLFANPRSKTRCSMTLCASFDEGKTWSLTKTVYPGACAYSSLVFNPADQTFYLLYEKGEGDNPYSMGIAMCEFNLEWLLEAE